jgi:hypothetical protein
MQRRLVLRGRGCCSSMPWDESIGGRRYMLEGLDGCELNARPRSRCPQFFFFSTETGRYQGEDGSRGRAPLVFSSNGDTNVIYPSNGQIFLNL